jgi:hypothetical protein
MNMQPLYEEVITLNLALHRLRESGRRIGQRQATAAFDRGLFPSAIRYGSRRLVKYSEFLEWYDREYRPKKLEMKKAPSVQASDIACMADVAAAIRELTAEIKRVWEVKP